MNLLWPSLFLFFNVRYGTFGYKIMEISKDERALIVKDPFCDYLFTPDKIQYYKWSLRPMKIKQID